jgi:formate dehydrogenase
MMSPCTSAEERLKRAPKLKLILTAGVGSDHIDIHAAADAGVTVAEMTGAEISFDGLALF